MKKIVILQHNGGQLANQLWLYISVYAYVLEKRYAFKNYSFFEYSRYFSIPSPNGFWGIFFRIYNLCEIIFPKNRRFYRYVIRSFYSFFVFFLRLRAYDVRDFNNPIYLPPSQPEDSHFLEFDAQEKFNTFYLSGWLFRNPVGILKYKNEIKKYFSPKDIYICEARERVRNYRETYKHIVGVHIRRGDYSRFAGGIFYVSDGDVVRTLKEYLHNFSLVSSEVAFLIFSDEIISKDLFSEFNVFYERNTSDVGDLFELSMVDCIIGSNSTFGAFASYYGDIPHVVFQKNGIDWEYYRNKKKYFENKYVTVVRY